MRRLSAPFLFAVPVLAIVAGCAARPDVPPSIPVFFQNGSVTLGADARDAVARAATLARAYPKSHIQLVGFALPSNSPVEPVRLSIDRAAVVRDELVRDGVDSKQIQDYGRGALEPPTDTPVGSRRVDIRFRH